MVEPIPAASSILPVVLKNATVRKQGKTILAEVTLTLGKDGLTIVMGPNGSGKTTLLRLMHGLERPRPGTVGWNCPQVEARTRQAFVFQTPVLMRRSVTDNIAYPLKIRGTPTTDARNAAESWATNVGLGLKFSLEARFLSGGERQKLAIARALITKPEVLFLDEPTTNLDGTSTREIEAILLSVHEAGTRIVMTTHDIGQAKRLATDIVFLNNGKICEQSPAEAFFAAAQTSEAQAYLKGDIVE
ncbi:MAG: ATP-binding cassette domain-containing protein [Rhizobiaceae bacterium]